MNNENNQNEIKTILSPHDLARRFEIDFKNIVIKKFSELQENLLLLVDDSDGVYISEEDQNLLCCLITSTGTGHLYLATAVTDKNGNLSNFLADVIA